MNTSVNNFDSIEELIYQDGLSIKAVHIHKDLDMMIIILNTGTVMKRLLSFYKRLKGANQAQLTHFRFIGKGRGIHWPELDEDLSLKGFLREEIQFSTGNKKRKQTA